MSRSDDHFDEFEPHTRFKHRVLKSYFDAWPRILLLRQNAGDCVVYVDACAGRGADDAGNHGSPVLAARIASEAAQHVGTMRNSPVNVQVIAIEKDPTHFKELEKNLAPFSGHARALHGTLADHIDAHRREFPTSPKFYFIDPFGLEPLDGATVRHALEGPKNEVLVLFASIAARRHFRLRDEGRGDENRTCARGAGRIHVALPGDDRGRAPRVSAESGGRPARRSDAAVSVRSRS